MGFWSFLRKKPSAPEEGDAGEPAPPAPAPPRPKAPEAPEAPAGRLVGDLAKLVNVGLAGGPTPEEALWLFRNLRSTPDEARAVEELASIARQRELPEALVVTVAATLVDRGEIEAAARVLTSATSSGARVMQADLAERRGDIAGALSLVERVLLRDLDHPGARERHRRWQGMLGFQIEQKPAAAGATVVAREPDAPFDLLREVGRGGAGAVYQALDRELGRHVALKVYHQPERDRAQLSHEARVAVALAGPGIVEVYDLDPDHGWIALGWAEHGTLRDHVRGKNAAALSPIVRWAMPLAQALARVHAGGWVHHDVKPANVLVGRTGGAILTDFGTARRIGEPSPPGSLGYISPERMKGRVSDPRDDIYGFGRIVEDVLDAVADDATRARLRPLATACTGPDDTRPADGRALVTRMRVELAGAG